jgi:hypothetical protein
MVVSLWFVGVSTTPELAGHCPMHGSHKAPTMAGMVGGDDHQATGDQPAPQRGMQCSCPDQCCSTPPVALLSVRITLAEVLSAVTRATGLADYDYVPVAARHLLPLAHAPPQAA